MGALNKAMVYLGLADNDDQYHIDDMYPETGSIQQIQPTGTVVRQQQQARPQVTSQAMIQAQPQQQIQAPQMQLQTQAHSQVVPAQQQSGFIPQIQQNQPIVRQAEVRTPVKNNVTPINKAAEGQINRITTIHPRSFSDAKLIGESFRNNVPVIMNLTDLGEVEAKRLVDFSAGLIFGMHGSIDRVTNKVFLLSPSYVEVVADEQPRRAF
ncbi:MAG: cell division protein SepF [Micrococcaceae bacterium]